MLTPHHLTLGELVAEESISEATLYDRCHEAHEKGRLVPDGATGPEGWS